MRDFHCTSKTQIPPLAPNGGEGSGVRGPIPLETNHHPALQTQTRLPHCSHPTSVASVPSVVKKTAPLKRHKPPDCSVRVHPWQSPPKTTNCFAFSIAFATISTVVHLLFKSHSM
jgi:hypothetical protein